MTVLSEQTWTDVARLGADQILAMPIGSTEQHGPHLPLSTDTDLAVELCRRLAASRDDVVVAPALPYGSSGEHAGFSGTLSIGQDALELVLVALLRSAFDTFQHVLVVSGHGGNAEPLLHAERQLRAEGRDVLAHLPVWSGDAHAGRAETSIQLFLHPAAVRAEQLVPGVTAPIRELMPALRARGVREVSSNGVLGDPRGASAEEGRLILAALADQLCANVDRWRRT